MLVKFAIAFGLYLVIAIYGWEFLVLLGAAIVGLLAQKAFNDD
jgi:hypothetical protein